MTQGERYFPHEYLYRLLNEERVKAHYQIDPGFLIHCCGGEKSATLLLLAGKIPRWAIFSWRIVWLATLILNRGSRHGVFGGAG